MSKASRRAARAAGSRAPGGPAAPARSGGAGTSPSAQRLSDRAGRRERARTGYARKPLLERYRSAIITLAVVAGVVLIGAFVVAGATAKPYTCTTIWQPDPTPEPSPGQSPRLGYVQRDMGNQHNPPVPTRYTLCPPASGSHFNISGQGPIQPRLYGPDDFAPPQGWIHNLEHGAIVVLYRGGDGAPGVTDEAQEGFREFFRTFPASPLCGFPPGRADAGLVIARFDDMAWPYAALVWDRVLPMETWDPELVKEFFRTEGERTNPEQRCARPTPSPGPSDSPAPSGSVEPSGSITPSASPAPSS